MRLVTIFVVAVLLSGCESPKPQPDGTPPQKYGTHSPQEALSLWTVKHREHLYVARIGFEGHFIHSPECPCQQRRRHLEEPTDDQ